VSWRTFTDWAKTRPPVLRLAARMGRSRQRDRLLDRFHAPPAPSLRPDLSAWEDRALSAVWIGHATVLLRIAGMTVLTDPVFFDRIGLGAGLATLGPKRRIAAALAPRELPRLDLILLSHAHFDHLDRPSLNRLSRRVPVITAPGTLDLLADLGFASIAELAWGASVRLGPLTVTARQVRHWGARTFYDTHRGYNAYMLAGDGRRILYFGDTAEQDYFRDTAPVDLAVVGISAYNPFIQSHATPEQIWRMANDARADFVLPMHHGTFQLSHEPMHEPLERLLAAAGRSGADRIVVRRVGEQWEG